MSRSFICGFLGGMLVCSWAFSEGMVVPAWGQTSATGAVTVAVLDPSGATVPGAELQLKDLGSNDLRKGTTQANGTYVFPNLPFGAYELTVSKSGFVSQVFESVQVQTARVTTVNATLHVSGTSQVVTVSEAVTPLVEADSSTLSDTIDLKQVTSLPMQSRSVMSLAFLVPGWSSTNGVASSNGTWDNLPGGAVVSADFDGTPGISNRFRSGGFNYGTTAVEPRIEDVAEMTIQTAQLDLGGTGTSAMRIAIVTRRGSNQFHGRVFEDFRNTALNANSWSNNARKQPRNIIQLNDFGGNVGGPILKNKLFFFGTWAQSIQPSRGNAPAFTVLNPAAQQGIFTYKDSSGNLHTANVLQIAGRANKGYRSTVLPNVADQLQKINSVLNLGTLTQQSDPNLSTLNFQFQSKTTTYYPTLRFDYHATENVRLHVSYAQTKRNNDHVNAPLVPGGIDPLDYVSNGSNNRIAGFGVDWTIRPTLINQFHAGYMYQYSIFDRENLSLDLPNLYRQNWAYGQGLYGGFYPRRPISSFYPLVNAIDSVNWQKGAHSFVFGGSWYLEHDHYWNGPGGEPNYNFGVDSQDPVGNEFTIAQPELSVASTSDLNNAKALYATLTGRVSRVGIGVGRPLDPATGKYLPFGAYNLNEVVQAGGFWAQDHWRLKPNFAVNYGLRWDIVGDDHDINGGYSALPTLGDLWGPTPVGAPFQPGNLGGVANPVFQAQVHTYKTSKMNLSPALGIAWSPAWSSGILGKLAGKDKAVIRAGYSLRHYTEGAQNFWAFASNSGQFFFQGGVANPGTTNGVGSFVAGSLTFGDSLPQYQLTPTTYSKTVPAANLALSGNWFYGMNPNIRQPYVEQWNLGIQRQIGAGSAIEVRYVGNLSLHQWLAYDINEVNIFENGFLKEFVNAQNNLNAFIMANPNCGKPSQPLCSFANNGLPGQTALPIFTAAFGSATPNFASAANITSLQTGAAGQLAQRLASTPQFFCNMVGSDNFAPCLTNRNINTGPGKGYKINFWQANPYAEGGRVWYLDAAGHTNYHALQIEFRQRQTHGMQFNVNYTFAHSLGIAAQNGIQGQDSLIYYTQRNIRLNYGPSLFDIRHVVHASGTYDLPFGKGKPFLKNGRLADYAVGGWTIGTIVSLQSGNPAIFGIGNVGDGGNGYRTVNNNDPGVVFNGTTVSQLQQTVGVYRTKDPWVLTFDPKFIASNGIANPTYITPASTPGVFGYRPYVYGPGWYNIDLSVNKSIPIRESVRFTLNAEFLNATNHPTFNIGNMGNLAVQSTSFGQQTNGNAFSGARRIELRANIEF